MLKRTPLYETHQQTGGRLVDFAGWEMPLIYTSIIEEHLAVRRSAGLFDISHMGQIRVRGSQSSEFLNTLLVNDLSKIKPGQAQYSLLCLPTGGVIDDLYVYQIGEQDYWLVVNASRFEADRAWMERQKQAWGNNGEFTLESLVGQWGGLALQGPKTTEFVARIFKGWAGQGTPATKPEELKKNQFAGYYFGQDMVWVARTGYTGEDGFEIMAPNSVLPAIWQQTMASGASFGLKPAGLGARDTLRTEAGYPLYGHELDEQTTPVEAGLSFFVGFNKSEFIGREVLIRQKQHGTTKKLVAFKMSDKGAPPRPGYKIYSQTAAPQDIGVITSGTQSPSLGLGIGMGYVKPEFAKVGQTIAVEIRGKQFRAEVVSKPIYKKEKS